MYITKIKICLIGTGLTICAAKMVSTYGKKKYEQGAKDLHDFVMEGLKDQSKGLKEELRQEADLKIQKIKRRK